MSRADGRPRPSTEQERDRPRVLLVYEPPDGGVAEHVCVLALGLSDLGFDVDVAGPAHSTVAGRLRAGGIAHHSVDFERSHRRPWRDLRAMFHLRRLITAGGYAVVHTHSSKAGAWGRLARGGTRTASVYSPHCFGFIGDVGSVRRWIARIVEKVLAIRTDMIICVCEDERAQALSARIAGPSRLRTVLQGSPVCRADIATAPELQPRRPDRPLVGAITALRRQKRVDVLLRAIPEVWTVAPHVDFAVVGNGPCHDSLVGLAGTLGLLDDPRFAMFPFEGSSDRYLAAMSVFTLSSDWEGLPISVLEAMACGVPPVVTDVGGIREVVDDSVGHIVPPRDPHALAQAIIDLISDEPRRAALGTAAVERHAAGLTIDRVITETAAVYEELWRAAGTTSRRHHRELRRR